MRQGIYLAFFNYQGFCSFEKKFRKLQKFREQFDRFVHLIGRKASLNP
jgi:hypothetical protein